jgi:hypothetical protein
VRSLMNVRGVRLGYDADRIAFVDLKMRGVKLDTTENIQIRDRLLAAARNAAPRRERLARPDGALLDDVGFGPLRRRDRLGEQARRLHAAGGKPEFFST